MDKNTIFNKLAFIFKNIFGADISIADEQKDIDGWDSLHHIELVNEIEREFNVKFSMKEVLSFVSVKAIEECLSEKI
ncbi:MAG: acyl carrier protein [Candidatus Gastranaerophilaceae bacterium]